METRRHEGCPRTGRWRHQEAHDNVLARRRCPMGVRVERRDGSHRLAGDWTGTDAVIEHEEVGPALLMAS